MKIAAIILAAGGSRRMTEKNKLLEEVNGRPMIAQVISTALSSHLDPVIVVLGYEANKIRHSISDLNYTHVLNSNWEKGMSTSIVVGISALDNNCAGAMIILGDMPLITVDELKLFIEKFESYHGDKIIYPVFNKIQGNPVIFPSKYFNKLKDLSGDQGAKAIINKHNSIEIEIGSESVLIDIDTKEDLNLIKHNSEYVIA